jgi:WD40 repeat protein
MSAFVRHRGPITSTAGLGDGKRVVTGGYDGAVGLFDLDTAQVDLLGYHEHLVNGVVVDTGGRARAASCSSDYTVYLWDLARRERIGVLRGHRDDVEDFVFISPSQGVSASRDHRIILWDLDRGEIEHVFEDHDKDVLSLAYHEGRLYSSGDDKTLRVWDIAKRRSLETFGPFDVETDTCAIDPVHGRVILGCDDGVIRIFDVRTGDSVVEIPAHTSGIKKVVVSRNGDVLSAAYDQRILIWDGGTFELRLELERVPHKWERSFSFSPDGGSVRAGTFDGTVLQWNAADGRRMNEIGADGRGNACFNRVSASPQGNKVAVVADDGCIRLAEITDERMAWTDRFEPPSGRMLMNAVVLDEDARLLAAGAHDQKLHLYDLGDEGPTSHRETHLGEGPINFIATTTHAEARGDCFVGCYSGRVVRVSRTGEVRARLDIHGGAVKSLRLHPTMPLGVSCSADGQLRSWTLDGKIQRNFVERSAIINDIDIDPTGTRIASVGREFSLNVYELESGRLLTTWRLGSRSLKSVAFVSPELIFVGDYWGELIRVEVQTGEVRRMQIADNGLSSLARCGSLLIATSYDGSVYVVDQDHFEVKRRLIAMTQRVSVNC